MRHFGETQSKVMRAYVQNGQYHTIIGSRVRLTCDIIVILVKGMFLFFFFGLRECRVELHLGAWYSLNQNMK